MNFWCEWYFFCPKTGGGGDVYPVIIVISDFGQKQEGGSLVQKGRYMKKAVLR